MTENGEKSFKEKIQENVNMQRRIPITFPISIAERLDKYAKDNCNDCYWLAIKQLLDFNDSTKEKEVAHKLLDEKIDIALERLTSKMGELDNDLTTFLEEQKEKEKKPKRNKTFGGGN